MRNLGCSGHRARLFASEAATSVGRAHGAGRSGSKRFDSNCQDLPQSLAFGHGAAAMDEFVEGSVLGRRKICLEHPSQRGPVCGSSAVLDLIIKGLYQTPGGYTTAVTC